MESHINAVQATFWVFGSGMVFVIIFGVCNACTKLWSASVIRSRILSGLRCGILANTLFGKVYSQQSILKSYKVSKLTKT